MQSRKLRLLFVALSILVARYEPTAAQTFTLIENADKFAADVVQFIDEGSYADAAESISRVTGEIAQKSMIEQSFGMLGGKKFSFSKKVVDRDFNGALRQIVYYSYIDQLGFFYFRFNFKMTGDGWMLSNFTWKSETNELFPDDFLAASPQ